MPFKLFREVLISKPEVVHIQYESYGLFGVLDFVTTPLLVLLLKLGRFRTVLTLHSFLLSPSERVGDLDYAKSKPLGKIVKYTYQILRITVKIALRYAGAIIVHSEFTARRLGRILGKNQYKLTFIPIGSKIPETRLGKMEAKREFGFDADNIVLFFGFISEAKNIHELVAAFPEVLRRAPRSILVISGIPSSFDPEATKYLDRLKKQASITTDRIVFIDRFISPDEVDALFSGADVLVLTYSVSQASSAAISAALGYGLPVVIPEGGTSAIDARLNGFGLVYERGNAKSLCEKVTAVLTDPRLKEELATNALRTASKRSWDAVAKRTLQVYDPEFAESL